MLYSLVRSKLKENLHYQKHSHDMKLFENRYQVGDLVYLLGGIAKVGESRKLKPAYRGKEETRFEGGVSRQPSSLQRQIHTFLAQEGTSENTRF